MPTRRTLIGQLFSVMLLTIIADQLQKWWMLSVLYATQKPPIMVTDFFSLVMVWNRGISFGLLNRPEFSDFAPALILAGTAVILLLLLRLALRSEQRLERLGYGLVIGGAVGNVIDRLHFGAVADFFYFHIGTLGWPAFNLADSAICMGVFLLLLAQMRPSRITA